MIDTHCHILWGVDDASTNVRESMDMVRVAVADGISKIVATSHIKEPIYNNDIHTLSKALDALYVEIEREHLDIEIILGGENFVSHATMHRLEEGTFVTYNNNQKYMLIEFAWTKNMYDHPNVYLKKIIDKGYIPVIAHPERYEWVHDDYSLINRWRKMGCLMQVNRTSVFCLDKIEAANQIAKRMLDDDLVDLIASDAHRCYAPRLPKLSDVYRYIETHYGKEKAELYLVENPEKVIQG
ncbi:MAG: hypothetical protein EOM50_07515 [Erysipelotrichia bacterium]|nr:hypothetical protein [Erysipelotrichia bacterium]NCC54858.1 hypothetical protein [Erysipelotrichia bacterium]